jgi:hypothetical protein
VAPTFLPRDRPSLTRVQSVPLPQAPNLEPYREEYNGPCDTWDFYR